MKLINDLKAHNDSIKAELNRAIASVLDSGWFVLGPQVEAFEREFAEYCGTERCVSVANGTDALEIALKGLGVGRGDDVVVSANAGMYSTTAILNIGAKPVYADTQPDNHLIDPASVARNITEKTKVIIATHLFGLLADMDPLIAIAKQHDVRVLEDCAQAHGAERDGYRAGSRGDAGAFSFYPTKNLGALGDGGAIVTQSEDLASVFSQLRQYGWSDKYLVSRPGGQNSRLDELQAAVLRKKLNHLDRWNEARRRVAELYNTGVEHPLIETPASGYGRSHVYHLFVVKCDHRDSLRAYLQANNIGCDIHYPVLDKDQEIFADNPSAPELPNSERDCARILTLPCYPELDESMQQTIIRNINGWEHTE